MAAIEFPRSRTQPPIRRDRDRKRLNAQIARMVNTLLHVRDETRQFIPLRCECGVLACTAPVVIPRARLDAIRHDPGIFVVAPGHFVDTEGEPLASDLTYSLISYKDTEPILAAEVELAELSYHAA